MTGRRRALVLWIGLAILVAAIAYTEYRPEAPQADPEQERLLPGLREADLGQIDLFYNGRLATFLRSPGGHWLMHDTSHSHSAGAPATGETAPANAAAPDAAASNAAAHGHAEPDPVQAARLAKRIHLVAGMKSERWLKPPPKLSDYGLDNPPIAILLYARAPDGSPAPRPVAALYVGSLLPSNLDYYAQVLGERRVSVISLYYVDALIEFAFGINPNPSKPALPKGTLE